MPEDEVHALREEFRAFKKDRHDRDAELDRSRAVTMRWAIGIALTIGFSVLVAGWSWTDRISRDVTTLKTDFGNTRAIVAARANHEPRITVLETTYRNLERQIADGFAAIRSDIRELRDADRQ